MSLACNNTNSIYGYRYLSANNICLGIVFVNSGANVDQEAWLPRVSIHLLLYPLTRSFFFYPIRLACNTMSLACERKQENPGRTHTDTRPPGRSDCLVENKWSLCSILCVEWKSTGGNEPLRETGAAFFFVVLIN